MISSGSTAVATAVLQSEPSQASTRIPGTSAPKRSKITASYLIDDRLCSNARKLRGLFHNDTALMSHKWRRISTENPRLPEEDHSENCVETHPRLWYKLKDGHLNAGKFNSLSLPIRRLVQLYR